ncbi:phosphonate ABC transporter, permease protein PhnE [Tepidibacter aestuarii]|uniref:phosphonate ABC transporter, permease protein PhnE n=1 Tax=Tepidibacter aestuarii TaxID=2925782 RepID=UPI0020C0388B|nr:phosphonate ABC transporter, permease protein PhnE [Tepidibacter aestuarii]CAH2214516.1 phosphonate transport system permease protein [Tepidibacter aestuarii]
MNKSIKDEKQNKWFWVIFIIVFIWSAVGSNFNPLLFKDIGNTIEFINNSFLHPDWSVLSQVVKQSIVTIQIAIVGTVLPIFISIPLSFLAARNTSLHPIICFITRGFLSFIRSVPEIVFALLFVPTVSLGPFAGVLAITIHNTGVLGKMVAELIEAADNGPQEAVASTGASKSIVVFYGIVPQIVPTILSNIFYRLEVSIRSSLVLGLVGAGGIGQLLSIHFKIFQYEKVSVDILGIMTLVVLVDVIGGYIRRRVI